MGPRVADVPLPGGPMVCCRLAARVAALLFFGACMFGCDDDDAEESADPGGSEVPTSNSPEAEEPGLDSPGRDSPGRDSPGRNSPRAAAGHDETSNRVHLDLGALPHLADIDHHGLFVDFGTRHRFKYTSGNWNSGWGTDGMVDNEPVSRFGRMARIYFNVDEPRDLKLRLRVKSVGSSRLLSFFNGQALTEQPFDVGEMKTVTVDVAAEHVRAGENYLLLRSTEMRKIDDEDRSFEVAWLQVSDVDEPGELPRPLQGRLELEGDSRQAILLPAPTKLSWYLEIPEQAELALTAGASAAATLSVAVTQVRGERTAIAEETLGERWASNRISLEAHANQIVRLDVELTANGDARGAISQLKIVTPRPELPAIGSAQAPIAKNVIVLTIDTLRADKLKVYNSRSRVRTPAMDRFAQEATIFENAQSPENWTKPSLRRFSPASSRLPTEQRTITPSCLIPC